MGKGQEKVGEAISWTGLTSTTCTAYEWTKPSFHSSMKGNAKSQFSEYFFAFSSSMH